MSLQGQLISLIFVIFSSQIALNYVVQHLFVLPNFQRIEREEALKNMDRVTQAIHREVDHLVQIAADWAIWDDTYHFIQDRNDNYIKANLTTTALENLKVNLLYLFDTTRAPVWGTVYDFKADQPIALPVFSESTALPEGHPLTRVLADTRAEIHGLMLTELGTFLIAAQPILTSTRQGPVQGALVFGRLLDADAITAIAEQALVVLTVFDLKKDHLGSEETAIVTELGTVDGSIIRDNQNEQRVYEVLPDLFGQPILLLQVTVPNTHRAQADAALQYTLLFQFGFGVLSLLLLVTGLRRWLLTPLQRVAAHALDISQHHSHVMLLGPQYRRNNEIGQLAHVIERAICDIIALHEALAEQTQKALYQSKNWLQMALHAAHAGAWEWRVGTNEVQWSREQYQLLGLAPESTTPSFEAWLNALHPEDRAGAMATIERCLKSNSRIFDCEYRVVWPDGSLHWCIDRGEIMVESSGAKIRGLQADGRKLAPACHDRPADRCLQSALFSGQPGQGNPSHPTLRAVLVADHVRYRPFQAHQRYLRPRYGRRGADRIGNHNQAVPAPAGYLRALGR